MDPLYPGIVNSPASTTTSGISDDATEVPVADLDCFPPGPNLAVLGNGTQAETVKYGGKSTETGAGSLTEVTRGFQGVAKAWDTGTVIARRFTAYDYDTLRGNLNAVTVLEGQTAGEDLSEYDLVRHDPQDGKWYLTDGNYPGKVLGQIGMAISPPGTIQIAGTVTNQSWDFQSVSPLYVSNVPGGVSLTWGSYRRGIGYTVNSNTIYLAPNLAESPIRMGIHIPQFPLVISTDIEFFAVVETVYPLVSFDWDFGDNTSHGSATSPTHRYATPGIYTVVLTITDSIGTVAKTRITIIVYDQQATRHPGAQSTEIVVGKISIGLTIVNT